MMSNTQAIKVLKDKTGEIQSLKRSYRLSTEHTKWLISTIELLRDIFGQKSSIYINFVSLSWQMKTSTVIQVWDVHSAIKQLHHEGYLADLETARGLLEAGIDMIKRKGIQVVYEGKDTPQESSEIIRILVLIENKLRKVTREKPDKEKQVQDRLEDLFIGSGMDGQFLREKEHIPYATKTYVPDFIFKKIDVVVEVKLCDSPAREKQMIAEINDDIAAYKTKHSNLIFVIYDLGFIREQDAFKSSLEEHKNVVVKIVKH